MLSKKTLFLAVFILSTFLFGQLASFAQNTKNNILYDQPARLKVDNIANPGERDEDGKINALTEAFYPIGFSKSGNFAYYAEPADEACGCYFAKLVIQDLRTDKILWEYKHEGIPTDVVEGEITPNETIAEYWEKNKKLFSRKLAQYGIMPENQFSLNQSISYQNDVLTPKLDLNIKKYDEYSADGNLDLWMISEQKGKKTIYSKKYQLKDYTGFRGAEVAGILKNPFSSNAAVVIVEMYRGYEGPPHTTSIRIVGTDLTSRFK